MGLYHIFAMEIAAQGREIPVPAEKTRERNFGYYPAPSPECPHGLSGRSCRTAPGSFDPVRVRADRFPQNWICLPQPVVFCHRSAGGESACGQK
jgi:hypothetical protein